MMFFSSNLSSYAQDYVPILHEGSFWDTEEIGPGCIYIQRLAIDKDTIINNVQYKSLKSLYFRDSNGNNSCISPPYEAYGSDFKLFQGLSSEKTFLKRDSIFMLKILMVLLENLF
jgi:hypothetical protein